jgi:hypothetical protein
MAPAIASEIEDQAMFKELDGLLAAITFLDEEEDPYFPTQEPHQLMTELVSHREHSSIVR